MKYIDAELLRKEIEFAKSVYSNPQRVVHGIADAFRQDGRAAMCDDILKKLDSLQQEQPMPDSTKLIELWHENKEMLKEKDFRDDPWRLAYNAFLCGFGRGIAVKKQEQPEMDLGKFTEKIKTFQGRYKYPEILSIKGAMAFMARMFYQYPNVARQWYDRLPKTTMD